MDLRGINNHLMFPNIPLTFTKISANGSGLIKGKGELLKKVKIWEVLSTCQYTAQQGIRNGQKRMHQYL